MDSLSRLPPECIQHILGILAQQRQTHALAAFLVTNKNMAFLTLPYLYADPYRLSLHTNTPPKRRIHNTPGGFHTLTRMLLARVSEARLPFLLHFALQVTSPPRNNTSSPTSRSIFDYCAYIRHLNMDKESIDINKYWPEENPSPKLLEFLQGVEFAHQCGLDRMLPTYYGRYAKERHLQQFYRVMLFREATWALAEPILEQLQSLTIPVSAIDQFLSVVARLERLERIRFLLDALFDYRASYVWTAALEELMFPIDDLKNQTMHKMIQFVKEHAMLFPGQLVGGVSYVDGDFWVDAPQSCPRDIQLDVARWLPPLKDVSIVTDENWLRLEAHITSMDLGQVESIINRNSGRNAEMSLGLSIDDGDERPFLQRCRSLKLLEVVADGTVGRFKWAVEEKRRALGRSVIGVDTSTSISEGARTSSLQSAVSPQLQLSHQQHLIPLTKFTLTERFERIRDEVDDITFAFSQTLTHLNISSKDSTRAAITQFGFGRVDLPVLTHLTLSTDRRIAVIDEQFLLRCPSLKSVTFADKTFYYQLEDIVTSAPGSLPQLEHLDLMGMNALKFHPTTLDSTPNLVSLRVGIVPMHDLDNNDFFIPSVEQLNRSFGIQNEDDSSNSNPTISLPTMQIQTWQGQNLAGMFGHNGLGTGSFFISEGCT